jgi:sulfopropanediol 3-dehydrogenase
MATYLKQGAQQSPERSHEIAETVSQILLDVESEGLPAIRRYSARFDGWNPASFQVPAEAALAAGDQLSDQLRNDIDFACRQIGAFARLQLGSLSEFESETLPGITLGQRLIPVASAGSYSPGGRYPLIASSIMTIMVPRVAGVDRVVAAAPPSGGQGIYPAQAYTMALSGADQILCLGGVQAFAALAFGIEDIGPVDFIAGAGNAYVAEAKRQLFGRVGIDLLAGPSEVAVICDDSADPRLVAADLLGQAEHGPTSSATCITTSHTLGAAVLAAVNGWLAGAWPTKEIAGAAWRDYGSVVVCADDEEAVRVSDQLAPEHLEIQTADPDWYLGRLRNYGSLFLGRESTVAYSDKAIGTNHVLPTVGAARYTGGLWVGKFLKTVTYQKVTPEGSRHVVGPTAGISDAEQMSGHALTARVRLDPDLLAGSGHAEQAAAH